MDRDIDVRTPESVAFRYELAGLGSRFLALFIDTVIQLVVFALIIWGVIAVGSHAAANGGGVPTSVGAGTDRWAESIGIAIVVAIIFLIFYGYFILFEVFWNGQTPGKKMLHIRVVRDGGYPVDFGASFLRNVIRIAEQLLAFYAVSAIVSLTSTENKRIGDYAAGTIVVREGKYLTTKDFLQTARTEPARMAVTFLTSQERGIIRSFLDRRFTLSDPRRATLAATLAAHLRPKLAPDLAALDDETLLEQLERLERV